MLSAGFGQACIRRRATQSASKPGAQRPADTGTAKATRIDPD